MLKPAVKIGIIGCGAIGEGLALFIHKELAAKAILTALADKNKKKAVALGKKISKEIQIRTSKELVKEVDLIIEAASQEAAKKIIQEALAHKKDIVVLSVGALIKNPEFLTHAAKRQIKLYIPSGAISGIDGLAALAKGNLKKITLTTSKPPAGLKESSYLKNKKIKLKYLKKPITIFSGTVEEAIKKFPKNINVAATLLLASRFNQIKVAIKADPNLKKNVHKIEAIAEEANLKIEIKNVCSKINPKTSALTILSAQHLLEKIFSSIKVGT